MFGFHVEERCPGPLSCRLPTVIAVVCVVTTVIQTQHAHSHEDVLLRFHMGFCSMRFRNYAIRRDVKVPRDLVVDTNAGETTTYVLLGLTESFCSIFLDGYEFNINLTRLDQMAGLKI